VIIVLGGIGGYLLRSPSLHWLGVGCVVVSALFALMLVAALTIIPRFVFRREPKFRDDYSLTFSAEVIHFRTAHIDSQLQWSVYSRALIDAHSYVLYYGTRQFTVIINRCRTNPPRPATSGANTGAGVRAAVTNSTMRNASCAARVATIS